MKRKNIIIKLDECKFIRKSGNAVVYLMKNNNTVKVYQNPAECKAEYTLLKKINNPYFPKVFYFCGHYYIGEYIDCINIIKYISIYGFNKDLALNLITFVNKLLKLDLPKLNITLNDIFIRRNLKPVLLNFNQDPAVTNLYEHIFKDLDTLNLLDTFFEVLKNYDKTLFINWTK